MKKTFAAKSFASHSFRSGNWTGIGIVVVGNGPYTIEHQHLYTPGTIEANVWPVGTDVQLVFTPGSFQINVIR